ncbi:hypothetical protein BV25DRAFT_1819526 [Artomyces pyxidatus]|uniref:Uncharacterized protein n=1 Tax=Artomyces pyxidatus TaxID=48021 RepID=A0ACB8TFK9_9AGAM|nr:hypothetical protein BV25DRAFT_1819526 [Artomyces pyxidatus]
MAKTATDTTTKTATRRANAKTTRTKDGATKTKRAPSAYNNFVKAHMSKYLAENQGKTNRDAMTYIGALWKDAPENPNRGKEPVARKPKVPKRSKKDAEGPQVEPSSDD